MTSLLSQFIAHQFHPKDTRENNSWARLNDFLKAQGENAFGSEIVGDVGHIVAQSRVENRSSSKVLLVFSSKEGCWKYPGAHVERGLFQTAIEEASHALGRPIGRTEAAIYGVSERVIPEYWNTPAHIHFEITFRFVIDETEELPRGARWYSTEEAERLLQASPEVE